MTAAGTASHQERFGKDDTGITLFHAASDVKTELASFDRLGLLWLIQDLYAAGKDKSDFSSRPIWI